MRVGILFRGMVRLVLGYVMVMVDIGIRILLRLVYWG